LKSYISSDPIDQDKGRRFKRGASVSNEVDMFVLPPKVPRKIEFKITTKTGIV